MSDGPQKHKFAAVIFDVDGTLVDCNHRRHLVETQGKKDWPAFFAAMTKDKPNAMVVKIAQHLSKAAGYEMLIVTGRPATYRKETTDWLFNAGIGRFQLYLRPDRDFRPDHEFKRELYTELIEPHYRVDLVVDDRSSVVDMWRELGLECWQVARGLF